jgi:phosphocarrier protein HPr
LKHRGSPVGSPRFRFRNAAETERVSVRAVEAFKTQQDHVMKATRLTVKWKQGLHMRAAAELVRLARRFRSRIYLRAGAHVADARSIMSLMILCAGLGSALDVEASGDDEHEAIQAVEAYFDTHDRSG